MQSHKNSDSKSYDPSLPDVCRIKAPAVLPSHLPPFALSHYYISDFPESASWKSASCIWKSLPFGVPAPKALDTPAPPAPFLRISPAAAPDTQPLSFRHPFRSDNRWQPSHKDCRSDSRSFPRAWLHPPSRRCLQSRDTRRCFPLRLFSRQRSIRRFPYGSLLFYCLRQHTGHTASRFHLWNRHPQAGSPNFRRSAQAGCPRSGLNNFPYCRPARSR